jgi:putative transposase
MMDRFAQRKLTQEKRQSQCCKVFEAKIDRSHLSKTARKRLEGLFREAKWFYNYCLSHDNINDSDTTAKQVPVKVGDEYETRKLSVLTSQMKQGIKTRLFGSLASLHALKNNGRKVGRLKFKGQINSIPLKQYNNSYYIRNGKIRLQGMKQWLRVRGLEQVKDKEVACATLVRKCNDYYIHITTYSTPEVKAIPEAVVGIDFGCETQLTFSNGVKVKFQVAPSKRLRKLDRKIMKGRRLNSKNKEKDKAKRRKEYERLTNKRKDIRHKLVNAITSNYKVVCFQDESIHAWHSGNHGKNIQFSGIGGIISDLKHKSHTPLEVNKFFPSTKLCPNCGKKNQLTLEDRLYQCECGFEMDRDTKSAICIKDEAIKQIPTECRKFTPAEISTSAFVEKLSKINGINVSKLESLMQEAPNL